MFFGLKMLLNDIRQLFKNKKDHISFLKQYSDIANSLMYHDEDFIREVTNYLTIQIVKHAQLSDTYKTYHGIITKAELTNKNKWYLENYDSFENSTSGSTGTPFRYKIWKDTYNKIECNNHYKTINDEFNLNGPVKILYLHADTNRPNTSELVEIYRTQNPLVSHGFRHQAEIHSALLNKTFYTNYNKYYEELIDYIIKNNIDIIHTQNNNIISLAWQIKRLGIKNRICKLISNTGSKLDISKTMELQNNGNIDAWCDHMRCWDGGVTFFTCKYNIYHLLDSLSWAYTNDYKLISYDYFSLPSPFINYWNGDYAEINDEYKRCKCGRAYREFNIGRTRSKITQISEISSIQSTLINNNLTNGLKRIEITFGFMRIFTKYFIPNDQRQNIRRIFPEVSIQFIEENDE